MAPLFLWSRNIGTCCSVYSDVTTVSGCLHCISMFRLLSDAGRLMQCHAAYVREIVWLTLQMKLLARLGGDAIATIFFAAAGW